MVEYLIKKGGDPNALDVNGETPYDTFTRRGHKDLALTVQKHGGRGK